MTPKPVNPAVLPLVALLCAACLSLSACKIERKSEMDKKKATAVAGNFENAAFDPQGEVKAMWETKVLPAFAGMAADFPALKKEMSTNVDAAGAQHGHRTEAEGAPWNLVTHITGKVVEAETELSAGTADVDVDGDGLADVQIQIGPVIKGTTIRDVLPFISFSAYTNQIDFAQLANAFNDRAFEAALAGVDREKLKGQLIEATGVFTADSSDELPVVTVVAFKVVNP